VEEHAGRCKVHTTFSFFQQNVYAPEDDPNIKIVHYERTEEQNDELGISAEMIAEEKAKKETAKS
jgi:zinc finger protein